MGVDKNTRDILKDIATFKDLVEGHPDINRVRESYDDMFSRWTAASLIPTNENWVEFGKTPYLDVTPANTPPRGTMVFLHGGGWSLGSAVCYAPLARYIAGLSQLRVIVPDFPQSPEQPYPAALNALTDLVEALLAHDNEKIFLAGDSAGGTLCAVLSNLDVFAGRIAAQALLYPVLDLRLDAKYRSRERFGRGKYFLTNDGILGASMWYCGEHASPDDPRISPILAPNLSQSPPTFFFLPEFDPLRDEAEHYEKRLREQSVETHLAYGRKTIHGCISFNQRLPQGVEGVKEMIRFFHNYLD